MVGTVKSTEQDAGKLALQAFSYPQSGPLVTFSLPKASGHSL